MDGDLKLKRNPFEAEDDDENLEVGEPEHSRGMDDPTLEIEEEHPGCVNIYFQEQPPDASLLGNSSGSVTTTARRVEICRADAANSDLTIYPILTWIDNPSYLKQKYLSIKSITLSGYHFELPESGYAAAELFLSLPTGFIKDYRYGGGLKKEYLSIIHAIEEDPNIQHLVIDFRNSGVKIEGDLFILGFDEFDKLRKAFNRTTAEYRRNALTDKRLLAYNMLLGSANSTKFPPRIRPYRKDTIYKIVNSSSGLSGDLSKADQGAILNLARKNKSKLMREKPKEFLQLHDEIEVVALKELIRIMREMIGKQLTEAAWQAFFKKNPFVLSMAFGYPMIMISDQVSVGGTKISGGGGKIADFLIKNSGTDNAALVEIKTPTTKLLTSSSYRGGIHAPAKELVGALNQCLDQRFMFQKHIANIKDDSDISALETYGVKCILIVGTVPTEKVQRKSFELFRHSLKDVEVVTFDELLAKLELILDFLAPAASGKAKTSETDDVPF
ncbi:MAG: Shedu immune nuclease family protein [Pseudomonadota bacterium]